MCVCVCGGTIRDLLIYFLCLVCIRQVCVCVGGNYKRFINLLSLLGLYKAGMCVCVGGTIRDLLIYFLCLVCIRQVCVGEGEL